MTDLPIAYAHYETPRKVRLTLVKDKVKRAYVYMNKSEAESLLKDLKTALKHPAFAE